MDAITISVGMVLLLLMAIFVCALACALSLFRIADALESIDISANDLTTTTARSEAAATAQRVFGGG